MFESMQREEIVKFLERKELTQNVECRVISCHRVTGWARSGAGPFQSPVLLLGTFYRIISIRDPTLSSGSFRQTYCILKTRNNLP